MLAAWARIRFPSDPESAAVLLNTQALKPGSVRARHNRYEQIDSLAPTWRLFRMIEYWFWEIDLISSFWISKGLNGLILPPDRIQVSSANLSH